MATTRTRKAAPKKKVTKKAPAKKVATETPTRHSTSLGPSNKAAATKAAKMQTSAKRSLSRGGRDEPLDLKKMSEFTGYSVDSLRGIRKRDTTMPAPDGRLGNVDYWWTSTVLAWLPKRVDNRIKNRK